MGDKLTLADFAPVVVKADITTAYGRVIVIPLQLMTYHEWQDIGLMVSDPPVPFTELDANNKPAANYQDKDYLKKLAEADYARTYARLARALTGGGGIDIPGRTLIEKGAAIRDTMDSGIVNGLAGFLRRASLGAEVTPHKDDFPGVSDGGDASVSADALDA